MSQSRLMLQCFHQLFRPVNMCESAVFYGGNTQTGSFVYISACENKDSSVYYNNYLESQANTQRFLLWFGQESLNYVTELGKCILSAGFRRNVEVPINMLEEQLSEYIQKNAYEHVKGFFESHKDFSIDSRLTKWDDTPLHIAARAQLLPMVELFLELKADVNATNRQRQTALQVAILGSPHVESDTSLIRTLLEAGSSVNSWDQHGYTSLHKAIETGRLDIVKLLLSYGCDINASYANSFSPLLYAIIQKQPTVVSVLIENRCDIDHCTGALANWKYPIVFAAAGDNPEICKLLCEAGCDLHLPDRDPLYEALNHDCSIETIRVLIDHGWDVHRRVDFFGTTYLKIAARKCRLDVLSLLVRKGASFSHSWYFNQPIMVALDTDSLEIVKLFHTEGVDLTVENWKKSTMLHDAAMYGSSRVIQYLLRELEVSVNAVDNNGKTALYLAAQYGKAKCLEILLHAGGNCYRPDNSGLTPLEVTAWQGQVSCLHLLLRAGCRHHAAAADLVESLRDSCIQVNDIRDIVELLEAEKLHVWPLRDMAAEVVRICLGSRVDRKVQDLEIPHVVKRLVALQDLQVES